LRSTRSRTYTFIVTGCPPSRLTSVRQSPEQYKSLVNMLKARIAPPPLLKAESQIISRVTPGATRTRDWILRSKTWNIDGEPFPVEDWAAHLLLVAENTLRAETRPERQVRGAEALLSALLEDATLASRLSRQNFAGLMRGIGRGTEIVQALFASAMEPLDPQKFSGLLKAEGETSFNVFYAGPYGYDVKAARRQSTPEAAAKGEIQ
jgi:hypothetical protein